MKQPAARQLGTAAQTAVKFHFEHHLGWGPMETGTHDLGTDLFVQMRSPDGVDLGLMLGVQVKTGNSAFQEPTQRDGQDGWWFRDSGEHADYWLTHHVPHIVILWSETGGMWWAPLDRERVERTASGRMRVFVSSGSVLDESSADALIRLAMARQEVLALQEAFWSFDLSHLPENDWARYAMLTPSLVSPNRNRSASKHVPLRWPEAAALCVSTDLPLWERFAQKYPEVPSPDQSHKHVEPGWRFAARVHTWMVERTWAPESPSESSVDCLVAAHAVCEALTLFEEGDLAKAIDVVQRSLERDLRAPDRGWLQIILARLIRESGDDDMAVAAFRAANASLGTVTRRDPTVDLLRSAALIGLFNIDPIGEGADLPGLIRASDSAPNWWRGQHVASGLDSLTDQLFDAWSGKESVQLIENRTVQRNLVAAWTNAQLSGAWESARSTLSLLARSDLMLQRSEPIDALLDLRRSGAHRELSAAVRRFRQQGPVSAVSALLAEVEPTMHRSTAVCDIELLAGSGAYCNVAQASAVIDRLADEIVRPTWLTRRGGPVMRHRVVDAISGLCDFVTEEQSDTLADHLLSVQDLGRLDLDSWIRLSSRLHPSEAKRTAAADRVEQLGGNVPLARPLAALAGEAKGARHGLAQQLLQAGRLEGLDLVRTWDDVLPESATAILRALERGIENDRGTRQSDGRLSFTMGGRDHLEQLARMLIFGPSVQGGWRLLLDVIADPTVFSERKRDALLLLTHFAEQVPEDIRLPLHQSLSTVLAQQPSPKGPFPPGIDEPIGGAVDIAWLEFHPDREDIAPSVVARLLSKEDTKADCASFLGLHPGWELVLVALLADQDLRVSRNAAESLAIRVARTPDDAPDWGTALLASVSRGGEAIAAAVTRGLSHPGALIEPAPRSVIEVLAALTTNESPAVRRTAERLLDERKSAGVVKRQEQRRMDRGASAGSGHSAAGAADAAGPGRP